ncbi:MAG: ATP-binding cassette domain-containing protein, partial [Deltaproteobacteria bacterium]|nr:ATP-binding cassette domain-containing protein [Deltaproteobacteria bacterium]
MLRIEELKAFYNSILALKGISIKVPKGEIFSIIGANGAGKSTLLKSVSGLIETKMGRILFKNQDIVNLPANRIVGLGISQVPEGRQLFVSLSVKDNIDLGAYLYHKRRYRKDINEKIQGVYRMFPILEKRSEQIAGTLSGGEQQMLAIARALMGRP